MKAGSPALRALGVGRIAVGGLWLTGLATGRPAAGAHLPRVGQIAAVALAARDLAQGALLVRKPQPTTAEAGGVVDVLHAASMLPVLAFVPRYRAAAATSAAAAAAWVGVTAWLLRREGH